MKDVRQRLWITALCLALLLPQWAWAQEAAFTLDEEYRDDGMKRSYRQGYQATVKNDELTLYYPLRTKGAVGEVRATLEVDNEYQMPFAQKSVRKTFAVKDGMALIKFTLPLHRSRSKGVYACTLKVEGKDAQGKPLNAAIALPLRIASGTAQKIPPLVRAIRVAPKEGGLRAGMESVLAITLKNESRTQEARGIAVAVSDAAGEILPAGADKVYVQALAPQQELALDFPIRIVASAQAKPHQVQLQFTYVDMEDAPVTRNEAHTVLIAQQSRLEYSAPVLPMRIQQGMAGDFAIELMNMGDGELRHVLLKFDLPGLAQGQSVLAGTIPRDENRTVKAALYAQADALGEKKGTVHISYEDVYGVPGSLEIPIATTVVEKPKQPPAAADAPAAKKGPAAWLAWSIAGALLAGLLAQGVLLRRKIRRLEEQGL